MEEKFKVPAISFLSGFFLWLIYIILHGFVDGIKELSIWIDFIICLVSAGLIVFSAYVCKAKGGPRIGAIVRISVLIVLSGITYWQLGLWTSFPLILGVILVIPLIFIAYGDK